jgi:hypothetical protein
MDNFFENLLANLLAKDYEKAIAELKNIGLDDQKVKVIGRVIYNQLAVLMQNNDFEFLPDIVEVATSLDPDLENQDVTQNLQQYREQRWKGKLVEVLSQACKEL